MKERLRALIDRGVSSLEDADAVAQAAGLLRDLLHLERQAAELLVDGARRAAESAVPYQATGGYASLTLHEAARRVLEAAATPLHVKDLGARIKAGGWRHPRSKNARPDQIEFQLAARLPRHPGTFRRVAPNTFGLTAWGDADVARRARPRLLAEPGHGPPLARRIGDEPDMIHEDEPRWRSS
ncbi:MAG TPA: winged helix-turn-helix domain-containing protein [Actinomycetota bacterium]